MTRPNEPDELLIAPPDRIFIMTRGLYHVVRVDQIKPKMVSPTPLTRRYGEESIYKTLCGLEITTVGLTVWQAYESEVCPACLLK